MKNGLLPNNKMKSANKKTKRKRYSKLGTHSILLSKLPTVIHMGIAVIFQVAAFHFVLKGSKLLFIFRFHSKTLKTFTKKIEIRSPVKAFKKGLKNLKKATKKIRKMKKK